MAAFCTSTTARPAITSDARAAGDDITAGAALREVDH
jgi:hypothetical protein